MKVSHKIKLGFAVLVAVLVGALAYQIRLSQRLAQTQTQMTAVQVDAIEQMAELRSLTDDLEENILKYYATRDAAYREKVAKLQDDYLARLDTLKDLVEALPRIEQLDETWRQLFTGSRKRAEKLEPNPLPLENLHEELEQKESELEKIELLQGLPIMEGPEESYKETRKQTIAGLRSNSESIERVVRQAIEQRVTEVSAVSERSRMIASAIAALAALATFLVGAGITRSINKPLRRLGEGMQEVADGRFAYQLDATGRDEFAGLAASFNTMVQRLDELDQLKKEFVARVSHDLKAPLAAMQETNQLLLDEIPGPTNEAQRRILNLNLDSGKRLSVRISKLLDLSRMAVGGLELDLKHQDLVDLTRFATDEFALRCHSAGVELVLTLPKDGIWLRCDRDRLLQVIENLLENGLKHSVQGDTLRLGVQTTDSAPPHLSRVWQRKMDGKALRRWCWLTLEDEGPGVPDEHKEAIFHEFHQVGGKRRGGVGLGLAICREIVDAHGGAIWVTDSFEGGSIFHLLLPATDARGKSSEADS